MNYQEFIDKIKKAGTKINETYSNSVQVNPELFYSYPENKRKTFGAKMELKFNFILEAWETGGVRGGSYWESSNPQPYRTDESAPLTFKALDKILTSICPQITFLQYRMLEPELVKYGEGIEYEYYGNRTDYSYRYINLEELYNFLNENNLIQ